MSGKYQLFKSGKTIRLRWDFCRSPARFGKSAGFRPEPEPKSSTALIKMQLFDCIKIKNWSQKRLFLLVSGKSWFLAPPASCCELSPLVNTVVVRSAATRWMDHQPLDLTWLFVFSTDEALVVNYCRAGCRWRDVCVYTFELCSVQRRWLLLPL